MPYDPSGWSGFAVAVVFTILFWLFFTLLAMHAPQF
jgi:hypothetical protein